jgi:hypothetical protein
LSDEEVSSIEEFVSSGGIVLADGLSGVMDESLAFRKSRRMADLFGIKTTSVDSRTIISMQGEPGIQLSGASALQVDEDKPILLKNRFGKGQTFLLNYFLHSYPKDKLEGRNQAALDRMNLVLKEAGIRPKVGLSTHDGEPVSGCASYLFKHDQTQLYGLVPDKDREGNQKVRISLGDEKTVYDVRLRRIVGLGSSFDTRIEPAVPKLFAFVSGKVTAVEMGPPKKTNLGDRVDITFQVEGVDNYRSVATVKVLNPTGEVVRYYGGNVDIINGKGSLAFRSALNDETGEWKVVVTDTISGIKGETAIQLVAK